MDLRGKRALIVRGADVIGRGIVRAFVEAGADVMVQTEETAPALMELPSDVRATVVSAGITQPGQAQQLIEQCVSRLGGLDVLVVLPARVAPSPFLDHTVGEWEHAVAANFTGPMYAVQAAARQMIAQGGGGRIIFVSSVASEMAFHETSMMGTSLAMVNALAKVAALDLGAYGITVNVVSPGWVDTGETLCFAAPHQTGDAGRAYIAGGTPLGRAAALGEIGALCVFLASEAAGFINGAYLPVDGGYTIAKEGGGTPYPGRQPWPTFDAQIQLDELL